MSDFMRIVANSPVLTERFQHTCGLIMTAVKEVYGSQVQLTPEDVAGLLEVRTAVLGNQPLGDILPALSNLDAIKNAPPPKIKPESDYKAETAGGEGNERASLRNAIRTMSAVRDGSIKEVRAETIDWKLKTDAERLAHCLTLSPGQRLAFAREYGLIK